jgi:phospholipase/carboxylesterase
MSAVPESLLLPLHWPEGFWQRPSASARAPILVLFHGLGAHWSDMQAVGEAIDVEKKFHLIALDAPQRPVSLNRGYVMPAWYDLYGLGPDSAEDETGLAAMAERLQHLLLPLLHGRNLLLGGFSQGAALSLYLGTRALLPARAILAFSGYLPLRQQTPEALAGAPAIFWGHGTQDDILPLRYAQLGEEILGSHGFRVQRHDYPIAHGIVAEEIDDARTFLAGVATLKH